ncbi:MAG: hypothetical protein ACTS6G_02415, partial [Candidatus Hodgkinia cicadicola]
SKHFAKRPINPSFLIPTPLLTSNSPSKGWFIFAYFKNLFRSKAPFFNLLQVFVPNNIYDWSSAFS